MIVSDPRVHFSVYIYPFIVAFLVLQFSSPVAQLNDAKVAHGFFMRRCLPRISLAASVSADCTAVLIDSKSVFPLPSKVGGRHFPATFVCGLFQVFWIIFHYIVIQIDDPFQAQSEGHHQKVMVTPNFPWKAPCTVDVHTRTEAFPQHDVGRMNLVVNFSFWTMFHLLAVLWWPKVFVKNKSLSLATSSSGNALSFVCALQYGSHVPCLSLTNCNPCCVSD